MGVKSATENAVQARKPWVRVVAWLAVVFTAWHIFASFLWIAPYSPMREVVPKDMLSSYMIPMFGQSWSVFAPEPINGDYHFNVRAVLDVDGEEVVTGWVSATDVEISMIQYNLFPPRAGIQSNEVASTQKGAFDKLNAEQQKTAALGFFKDDWQDRMQTALSMQGDAALTEEFVAAERRTVAYATQVAYAIWGEEDVVRVQYRVSRQNVIPFAERHNEDAVRPAPTIVETGWRGPLVEPGQNNENFAKTFRAQYERIAE